MQAPNNADPIETINREQEDDAQVLDANDMANRDGNLSLEQTERGGQADPGEIVPDDRPDLVETLDEMTSTGRIDNSAYAGERNDDDEEDNLGNLEDEDDEDVLTEEDDQDIEGLDTDEEDETLR